MVILAGLEAILAPLGAILGPLVAILGPIGTVLGRSWSSQEAMGKIDRAAGGAYWGGPETLGLRAP